MNRLSKLLFVIFWIICQGAFAQNLRFKHIGIADGLSNSTIECIFQDYRGFIWFGTRDGLNRYDGKQITVFKSQKNPNSLSDNYIRCIFESSDKTLWIGTANGLNKFDPELNTFKRHLLGNTSSQGSDNAINAISEYKNQLWIGTAGGLNQLDLKTEKIKRFRNEAINALHHDQSGNLWIASSKGLNRFDTRTQVFNRYTELEQYVLRTITATGDHILWLGTEDKGMIAFNKLNRKLQFYRNRKTDKNSLGSDLVRAIVAGRNKKLWIGGINGGLDMLDPLTQRFSNYTNEPGNASSLSQRTVSALFEDKQGNLWIGTHRGGINLYSPGAEKFRLIQQEINKNSLSYNDVRAFSEDKLGNLWIGTDGGGLNYFNRNTRTFSYYKNNPYEANSLGADAVLDVLVDRKDDIYVGTWGGGLNVLNKQTGSFTKYLSRSEDPTSISSKYVQKSFEDSQGNLWICTYYGGLNLFSRDTKKFKRVLYGSGKTRLSGNNIVSIAEDGNQNLWIGTDDGGLNRYNLKTKEFRHYFQHEDKKPDLRVIFVDSKSRLWIGQTGLYLFEPVKNDFRLYTEKAGLASAIIKGIVEDPKGDFWISTATGLIRFNPDTQNFTKYNAADGLQGPEFEANAAIKTRNGEIFFGGTNGINAFFPQNISTNKYKPPVYLTEFQIFNQKVTADAEDSPLKKDISFTKEIHLDHDQSTFSFSFAGLNYNVAENNKYAYKLEGFDEEWNYGDRANRAFYTNLDPGSYTFRVRASNNDDLWNNEGTAVQIIIAPPFWATWWFRLLVTGLVVYIVYALLSFKRRLEIKEIEERKRAEIHEIQLQFFTNISHEFRTPLSLILGPIDRLLKEDSKIAFHNYYKTIHRNANRLLSLINELMDFRKIESGSLKLRVTAGNLSYFIDEVAEEFIEMAREKNISLEMRKNGVFPEVWFDRQVIEKIILNLINNALKYTKPGGKVTLEILSSLDGFVPLYENKLHLKSNYAGGQYVYIRVADNGIGISKSSIERLFERYYRITDSHLGSGVGLAFVKSLTMLHKGEIQVSSEKHQGTEFIIGIPCCKADYLNEEVWGQTAEASGTRLESITYKSTYSEPLDMPERNENGLGPTFRRILIVDDNEELRDFLRDTLSDGYSISEAADGHEGLRKAKEESPDLIISDVMMPGMTGTAFCKQVKEDIEISHIPFLMLTAKNSIEAEIEGASSGADLYFTKPINMDLLKVNIKNIFDQRQHVKDHYLKDHQVEMIDLVHSTKDREFMKKFLAVIDAQLVSPELDIEYLCGEMGMSRTKLYQKIKEISGQSIIEFIRSVRLKKAVEIMTHEDVLLTEVMYRIGIQTQSYFSKAFKKEYGKTPSQFLQEIKSKVSKVN